MEKDSISEDTTPYQISMKYSLHEIFIALMGSGVSDKDAFLIGNAIAMFWHNAELTEGEVRTMLELKDVA